MFSAMHWYLKIATCLQDTVFKLALLHIKTNLVSENIFLFFGFNYLHSTLSDAHGKNCFFDSHSAKRKRSYRAIPANILTLESTRKGSGRSERVRNLRLGRRRRQVVGRYL